MSVQSVMLRGLDAAYPTSAGARAAGQPWARAMDPAHKADVVARAMDSPHDPTQAARNGARLIGGIPVLGEAGPEAAISGIHRPDVAVLYGSGNPGAMFSSPMFADAIERAGARPRLLAADKITIDPGGNFSYDGMRMKQPDAVISRGLISDWALEVADRLDAKGTHVVNRGWAIRESRGKQDMPHLFDKGGIPYPSTSEITSRSQLFDAADTFGFPFVVKEVMGSGGKQVHGVNNAHELDEIARTYLDTPGAPAILASEMIDTAAIDARWLGSRDPLGEPIAVAGLARYALKPGEFRANTSLGGAGARLDVSGSGQPLVLPDIDPAGLDPATARHMQARVEQINARTLHVSQDDNLMFKEMMRVTGLDLMGGDGLPLPPGQHATLARPGDVARNVNFKIAEVNQTPGSPEANRGYLDGESITEAASRYAIYGRRQ